MPDAYTDGVPRSPERNQSATALMLSVSLIVCGCVPHVRMVSAPPEVTIALTQRPELKAQILDGKRTRRLENVSIKLDRAQIQAVRKIATMKSI